MSLQPGALLNNRYRVGAQLGEGGMAIIYRGWDQNLNLSVAIKEMRPELGVGPEDADRFREQFRQEAEVLARLSHPHLVNVLDFFSTEEHAYLVMGFVEGESLQTRIETQGALPEAEVLAWAQQLLDALAYCHRRQVIHRDVKPSNIIIKPDGEAVLVDFGLVKVWDPEDPRTQKVVRGMGTVAYTPPEQYYGDSFGHTDARSDLYSLGATLYHALTGQAPPAATDRMARPGELAPPRAIAATITPQSERVVLKALSLQMDDRYPDAGSMAAALARKRRQHTWIWALAGLLLLALLAVGTRALRQDDAPPADPPVAAATQTAVVTATRPGETAGEAGASTTAATLPTATTPASPAPTERPVETPSPVASATPTRMPAPAPGTVRTNPADDAPLVYIPGGEFTMGLTAPQADFLLSSCDVCNSGHFEASRPAHTVRVDPFWIYQTEVTNDMYAGCVTAGACAPPAETSSNSHESYWGNPTFAAYPVVHVTWFDADNYCRWAGGRLPTSAEWEKAARGTDGRLFPWGDQPPDRQHGNIDRLVEDAVPVGSYPAGASPYGVLDMAGNVWEWVYDWFDRDYYNYGPVDNPRGPATSPEGQRSGRGGSWYWHAAFASAAYNDWWEPEEHGSAVGFRCAVEAE